MTAPVPTDPFESVLGAYRKMEPKGTDRWNPLDRDRELAYRLSLLEHLCRALRLCRNRIAGLRVLDVGCGNGRSTRMYLDFGLGPEQLTGIDLRGDAIEAARRSHPGIRFLACGARFPVESKSVDWVSICTVLSSLEPRARKHLEAEIRRVLAPGGFLFYFDRRRAHEFAGGDRLEPVALFDGLTLLSSEDIGLGAEATEPTHSALVFRAP